MSSSWKIWGAVAFAFVANTAIAQYKQSDSTFTTSLIPVDKQERLKNVDLIANMQYNYRAEWLDEDFQVGRFRMEQFRLEARGNVTDRIYFRFRHRYTSDFEPQSVDKIIKGVDFAYVTVKINDKWSTRIGKQYANWGGIEFDLNPIDIYEYSDIIEMADNFLSGASIDYRPNKQHEFGFQILNPRTVTYEEIYGADSLVQGDFEESKAPLAGVLTWRGSLLDGKLNTLWSYSLFTEAVDAYMNYFAFGQQLNLKKFSIAYDYKLSLEDIDRTGIVRSIIPTPNASITLRNTRYQSHWLDFKYHVTPKWDIHLTTFVDYASVDIDGEYESIRTSYGIIPAIEYSPFENYDFFFFVNYIGRYYRPSDDAKEDPRLLLTDTDVHKVSIGFISPLKFL